jgi:hypothetical protein
LGEIIEKISRDIREYNWGTNAKCRCDGTRESLAWSEWFCALMRRSLALHPDGPDAQHWRNWLFMVEQSRRAYRVSNDTENLLDDYRFWRERDSELKSLAASAPGNPDS